MRTDRGLRDPRGGGVGRRDEYGDAAGGVVDCLEVVAGHDLLGLATSAVGDAYGA